jgi:hypothetical protein
MLHVSRRYRMGILCEPQVVTIFVRRFPTWMDHSNTARLRIPASSDKARSGSSRTWESRLICEVKPRVCARELPQLHGSQRCETSSNAWTRLLHASSPFLESIAAILSNHLRSTWSGHFTIACFGTSLTAPNDNILGHQNAEGFIHGCFSTSSKEARVAGFAWSIRRKRSLQPFFGCQTACEGVDGE